MGAGSSSNKGLASRSRFSSWGSSIDEAICGEHALCGDYPEDDLEGFPLFSAAQSRRASIVTNPYIEATPRNPPKLRRAFSEGEASVRRAYTTDYSDNSDDPDTDDDYPNGANLVRKSRSAVMVDNHLDEDDFPNRPVPLPLATTRFDSNYPSEKRQKRRRKKAPKREAQEYRRPFSPSQLQNLPPQKLPKKQNRRSSMPRPESDFKPRRYSVPETIPLTSHSRRYSAFESEKDPFGNVETPEYSQPIKPNKPKKSSKKPRAKSLPQDDDDWLADYHLPSQVPTEPSFREPAYRAPPPLKPIKPITKTRQYDKEPNYKVPTAQPRRSKKAKPKKPPKKAPSYPVPLYSGLPTQYEPILQLAPPVRKGARIKPPAGQTSQYSSHSFRRRESQTAENPVSSFQ